MLARGEIPQSVCSLPCGLGEIKSFEVREKKKARPDIARHLSAK
jgi:hypothetical protein